MPRYHVQPLLAVVLLVGCADQATDPMASAHSDTPSFTIVDGAHGGNAGFYFLPPMVPAPTYTGTFDGTKTPTVRACQLAGTACGATVVTFSGAQVKLDAAAEAYSAVWKTKDAGLDPTKTYRIVAALGSTVLGYADVVVVANGSQIKTIDKNQFVATINGGTLQIKFRIERAAPPPPPPPPPCTKGTPGCAWQTGEVISHSQTSWGEQTLPGGPLLIANYDALYVTSFGTLEIGVPGVGGYSIIFSSGTAVLDYLPGTGIAAPLNADLPDPLSTASGVFAGDVLALRFNIDFSDAGLTLGTAGVRFGDLTLCGFTGNAVSVEWFVRARVLEHRQYGARRRFDTIYDSRREPDRIRG